jgi:hypothetical protein
MDIEGRLVHYRPAGPPPELRDRVLASVHGMRAASSRLTQWIPAMAAAAAALFFALMAQRAQSDIASRLAGNAPGRAEAVSALTVTLGGTELARAEAERMVSEDERRAADVTAALNPHAEQNR